MVARPRFASEFFLPRVIRGGAEFIPIYYVGITSGGEVTSPLQEYSLTMFRRFVHRSELRPSNIRWESKNEVNLLAPTRSGPARVDSQTQAGDLDQLRPVAWTVQPLKSPPPPPTEL